METLSLFGDASELESSSVQKGPEVDNVDVQPSVDPPKDPPSVGYQPLAYRMAPDSFDQYVGQGHLVAPGKPLRVLIESDRLVSMVLWGPPGCGKTSLSRLIATLSHAHYESLNAVTAKVADIKRVVETAHHMARQHVQTVLFVDEIHRFSKTQQDALLPDVENGTLILIGATTENPFFSVIPSLLSRSQVFELKPLDGADLDALLIRAIQSVQAECQGFGIQDSDRKRLIAASGGDARRLLNWVEMALGLLHDRENKTVQSRDLDEMIRQIGTGYNDEDHYNFISAFIKSMRGSDPDAALYWLARLLESGEDPVFIARRLVVFASEDVGNADCQALGLAVNVMQAAQWIGMPEIRINLAQVVAYLACAPKSNASYVAIQEAQALVRSGVRYEVPDYLKSHPPVGVQYIYPHNESSGVSSQAYLPHPHTFYRPKSSGFEAELIKRLRVISIQKQHG